MRALGVLPGEAVAVLAPNVPVMLEAHFGVPAAGAVLNALNTRLDAPTMAFMLDHGAARVLIVHHSLRPVALQAIAAVSAPPILVVEGAAEPTPNGALDYEGLLRSGSSALWSPPADEWASIALNYTSGTTGDPKGVLYHHRGAYLNALGNVITFNLQPNSVYLWTLPMFHCNGWTYPWAVTAVGGCHICLPAIDAAEIFRLIDEEKVTHLCAAPVVLTMLIHAPSEARRSFTHGRVKVATGGAAPPSAVIAGMEALGFELVHLYGMTECYGPSTACAPQESWAALPLDERALLTARQGVRNLTVSDQSVIDPDTGEAVPADGETLGELVLCGNTVMKGYLKNEAATEAALGEAGCGRGTSPSCIPIDMSRSRIGRRIIIISGGENISSLEVEEVLFRHAAVMEAAVVAAR